MEIVRLSDLASQSLLAVLVRTGGIQQRKGHPAVAQLSIQSRKWGTDVEKHLVTQLVVS